MVLDVVGEDGKMAVFIKIGNLATLIFSYLSEVSDITAKQSISHYEILKVCRESIMVLEIICIMDSG